MREIRAKTTIEHAFMEVKADVKGQQTPAY